jgi:hypothetical protein
VQRFQFTIKISSVNERFKNLIRERDDKLAIVLLAILGFLMVLTNRVIYPLLESPKSSFESSISVSLFAVVLAEVAVLSIWTVLSSQSFITRLQILFVATIVLFASWLLGYSSTFDTDIGLNLRNREQLYYVGWIPLLFLAMCVPLIVLRFFASRVLAPIDSATLPTRQPVTISGLMLATGLIAFTVAALQLPALIGNRQADIWAASGAFAGVFFLIGLVFVLPAVLILCSSKRSFLVWSPVILVGSALAGLGIVACFVYLVNGQAVLRDDDWIIPLQFTASAMLVIIIAIGIMRMFGYRLMKSAKAS